MFYAVLHYLEKMDNAPGIFQAIGLALLTILIPLAIAILNSFYRKKQDGEDAKDEFTQLDLHVILSTIFPIPRLIFIVSIIFIPLLFWEISSPEFRIILIILYGCGMIALIRIILKIHKWIKGNVFDFRFLHLRKLTKNDDIELSWHSVWQVKNINTEKEVELFQIFSTTIDSYLNSVDERKFKHNLASVQKLLVDFDAFINNRSFTTLLGESQSISKILQWHSQIWGNQQYFSDRRILLEARICKEILKILRNIFIKLRNEAFKNDDATFFFEPFVENKKCFIIKKNDDKKREYLEVLSDTLFDGFFDSIVKSDYTEDILKLDFPMEWKITKDQWKTNFMARKTCDYFINWVSDKIQKPGPKMNIKIGFLIKELFPEVDASLWSSILIFIYSSGDDIKSFLEKQQQIDNFVALPQRKNTESAEGRKNTCELALCLFPTIFSEENIAKQIKELESLAPYFAGTTAEVHRKTLFELFQEMLKVLHAPKI